MRDGPEIWLASLAELPPLKIIFCFPFAGDLLKTIVPAASPKESPSRFVSKGLHAVGLRDKNDIKPLTTNRLIKSPPVTITLSNCPLLIIMAAVLMASTPEIQALDKTITSLGLLKNLPTISPSFHSNTLSCSKLFAFSFSSKSIFPLVVEITIAVLPELISTSVFESASSMDKISIFSSLVKLPLLEYLAERF